MFSEKFITAVQSVTERLVSEADLVRATGTHKCVSREMIVDEAMKEIGENAVTNPLRGFVINLMLGQPGGLENFTAQRGQYGGIVRTDGPTVRAASIKKELIKAAKQAEKEQRKAVKAAERAQAKAILKAAKAAEKAAAATAALNTTPAIVTPEPTVAETV